MRALVVDDGGLRLETTRADPVPTPGEVLVRVLRAGICQTDLELVRGYHGFRGVLGHEFVGVPLAGAFAGQRVAGEINCSCWSCTTCLAGRPGHCPRRSVIGILNHDGAFADLLAIPERNLHLVPDTVETDAAVFAEPLAAAFEIPSQLDIVRDHHIVVLGDGRLGNLCAQVLRRYSDHVLVIGRHPAKLALLETLGIQTRLVTGDPTAASIRDRVADRAAESDIVVDCTGSPAGLSMALGLVRPRGIIVLKTTVAGAQTLSLAPVVVDEVTIVGSRCGPFGPALDALADGSVDVRLLISERFRLLDGVRALARAKEPGVMKVLLEP